MPKDTEGKRAELGSAEIGAIAHLYRGENYRSTIWRTRLDTTTNWSVVTLGIALSIAFSSPNASPLPLILVGILIFFFLMLEARRYRYFNVWRARCRWMEVHFFAPMLHSDTLYRDADWQKTLADDYVTPRYHVSRLMAMGRRVRRNYLWILLIQALAYLGKVAVHPDPMTSLSQIVDRAGIGPVHGGMILGLGAIYCSSLAGLGFWSWMRDRRRSRSGTRWTSMG